jgi:hypothetical protein
LNSSEQKPVLVVTFQAKWGTPFLVIIVLIGTIDTLGIVGLSLHNLIQIVAVFIVFFLCGLFFIALQKWIFNAGRIEFYENGFRAFRLGLVYREAAYSDVITGRKKRWFLVNYPTIYGKDGQFLTYIPQSNWKKPELGGVKVLDWLNTRISS